VWRECDLRGADDDERYVENRTDLFFGEGEGETVDCPRFRQDGGKTVVCPRFSAPTGRA